MLFNGHTNAITRLNTIWVGIWTVICLSVSAYLFIQKQTQIDTFAQASASQHEILQGASEAKGAL